MTDLEITRLCAEAMDFGAELSHGVFAIYEKAPGGKMIQHIFNPLQDDAQAMALMKRFSLSVWGNKNSAGEWRYHAEFGHEPTALGHGDTYNRAICDCVANECVAKAQQ